MREVLKMNELKENQLTSYENMNLNLLLSIAADIFDMFSDSMYGGYEACGNDKEGRHITIKVVIENEVHK